MINNQFFTLCSDEDIALYFGYVDKKSITRRVKDDSDPIKIKKYNSMQTMVFLDKENIDEETLLKIVKFYNAIVHDRDIVKSLFDEVVKRGLPDA